MNHPLTTCISEIGFLQERIREKNARIETLETALRTIRFEIDSQCGPLTLDTPRAALAPEHKARKSTTVPVCCYCDAPLSCARCGCEQPAGVAQAVQDRIEALEAEVAFLREANQTWADICGPSAALAPEQDK